MLKGSTLEQRIWQPILSRRLDEAEELLQKAGTEGLRIAL